MLSLVEGGGDVDFYGVGCALNGFYAIVLNFLLGQGTGIEGSVEMGVANISSGVGCVVSSCRECGGGSGSPIWVAL